MFWCELCHGTEQNSIRHDGAAKRRWRNMQSTPVSLHGIARLHWARSASILRLDLSTWVRVRRLKRRCNPAKRSVSRARRCRSRRWGLMNPAVKHDARKDANKTAYQHQIMYIIVELLRQGRSGAGAWCVTTGPPGEAGGRLSLELGVRERQSGMAPNSVRPGVGYPGLRTAARSSPLRFFAWACGETGFITTCNIWNALLAL